MADDYNITITKVSLQELRLSNEAPQSVYQNILREVYFVNTANEPGRVDRTVTFTIDDGNFSTTAFTTVEIIPTNDPAILNFTERVLTFDESTREPVYLFEQGDALLDPDMDGGTLLWVVIQIVAPDDPNDTLMANVQGTDLTVSFSDSRLLNISGNGTFSQYETVLSTVVYYNNFPGMNLEDRVIHVLTFDGKDISFVQLINVTIIPFDDQPMCYFNMLVRYTYNM